MGSDWYRFEKNSAPRLLAMMDRLELEQRLSRRSAKKDHRNSK